MWVAYVPYLQYVSPSAGGGGWPVALRNGARARSKLKIGRENQAARTLARSHARTLVRTSARTLTLRSEESLRRSELSPPASLLLASDQREKFS